MNESNALTKSEPQSVSAPMSVSDIVGQVQLIQHVMKAVMKEKEHYGKIPGCGEKPTLLKPGAEKLGMTFRLAPKFEETVKELPNGHREVHIKCSLFTIANHQFIGEGVGCCSTMEGKFRFRVAPKTMTDRPVPKEYWDLRKTDPKKAQESLGGPGFGTKKNDDGIWMITEGSNEKVEHDNPADYYNTVLKMAKKRAHVDAILTATAASDIFAQDIEDMSEVIPGAAVYEQPIRKPDQAPAAPASKPSSQASEEITTCDCVLVDFRIAESKPDSPKKWKAAFCKFEDDNGAEFEAGTFDAKLFEKLETLKGCVCNIAFKRSKKDPSKFELVSIDPANEVSE